MMNENLNKFDTLKLATQYWHGDANISTLIIIIFILGIVSFFAIGYIIQNRKKEKNIRKFFETFGKERELSREEIELLWKYANMMERDPLLVLEFKAPFERVIDLYMQKDPNPDENLIKDIRSKLGFDIVSPYIPIVTTKDIEIFQNGRMILPNNQSIDIAFYDKDERYMYWLVIDNNLPNDVNSGDIAKVIFIRRDDGIYTFEQPIEEIIKETGKLLIKFKHTFDLNKTQRREYPRIQVKKPITLKVVSSDNETFEYKGEMEDISAGGVKFCLEKFDEKANKIRFGDTVTVMFDLDGNSFELESKVLDIFNPSKKSLCFRALYTNADSKIKDKIMEFVQKEQLKQIKTKE